MRVLFQGVGLLALGLVLVGAARASTPVVKRSAPPVVRAELKKLHILMVFDTNDKLLSNSLGIDERRMKHFLKTNIPADRYSATVLKGNAVTPSAILEHYRDLKVEAGAGLMFFYGGHGATDPQTKQHYFKLACGKNLIRTELRKAMEARKSGAVLLLSDCCSTLRPLAKQSKVAKKGLLADSVPARELTPAVRCLLFQAAGTVDVTAATANASWSDDEKGGLFTRSLCRMLTMPVKSLDVDRDGFVTWKEFFPQLQKETQYVFGSWSKEWIARGETVEGEPQTPQSFLLGEKTYAVVGLSNDLDKVLGYRWRWQGQPTWNDEQLEPGKEKVHFLTLSTSDEKLPLLEVAISKGGSGTLKPKKWSGAGEPSVKNSRVYRFPAKKK